MVLLGTGGGGFPKVSRCGFANAVVVGDAAYLVDCGEGVHRQLWRAGLTVNPGYGPGRPLVRAVFVTHLHADHIMDLANLFQGSWPPPTIDVYRASPRRRARSPSSRRAPVARSPSPTSPRPGRGPRSGT